MNALFSYKLNESVPGFDQIGLEYEFLVGERFN